VIVYTGKLYECDSKTKCVQVAVHQSEATVKYESGGNKMPTVPADHMWYWMANITHRCQK